MKYLILFAALFLLSDSVVLAQPKEEFKVEVKTGATIYAGWELNADNANFIVKLDSAKPDPNSSFGYLPVKNQFETNQNSFFLERAYLNVFASLAPTLKGRLTSDVFSVTDGSQKTQYQLGIKLAWLDWTALKMQSGFSIDFVAGVIPNNWIPLNEKYFGYRGFAKTLTDYQWIVSADRNPLPTGGIYAVNRTLNSYFSSADLGANLTLTAPGGLGEFYLNILNGNGFRNLGFDNRFKDIEAIAVIHPIAGQILNNYDDAKRKGNNRIDGITDLTFGGFSYIGKLGLGENYTPGGVQYKRNRFGGMFHVSYNFKNSGFVKIGGEYSLQSNRDPSKSKPDSAVNVNATGFSTYLEINPPLKQLNEKLSLIVRYDIFDPDNADDSNSSIGFNNSTDCQKLFLLGLAYKPVKNIILGISLQRVGYQSSFVVKYDGSTVDSDSRFFFHTILDF